mmetsp:Transcript_59261/g.132974  ORF Transcript_59261/g.132974 Transcript_59261/m.132974 type:complete len:819 (+) Transcript_59261:88-2544(+)
MSAFEELGISPQIIQAIEEDDWLLPTAVQQEAIPMILTGGDVLVASETGSGKTGAFGLPCLQIVQEQLRGKCLTSSSNSSALCCLDSMDKDKEVSVLEDVCQCPEDKHWKGVRGTLSVLRGKYMYEVEVVEGSLRAGWSASFTKLELGIDDRSFGYGCTGKKSSGKKFEDFGEKFQAGDIIGCLLDREARTVSFCKNGVNLGVAYQLPEDLEVGLKPHICGKGFHAIVRFESMEFAVEGYAAIGEAVAEHVSKGQARASGKQLPLCLILEPTRDLAEQTFKNMQKFKRHLDEPPVQLVLLVGGQDDAPQVSALESGVDICVGTLQKTMDLCRRGKLDVSQVKFFVLDEADDLQKKDDRGDLPGLSAQIKSGRADRVQTLFFSATLHTPEVKSLIEELTVSPTWVDLKGKDAVPDTVHHVVYTVDPTLELPWTDAQMAERAKFPEVRPPQDGVHTKPTMSALDQAFPEALRDSERIKAMKPRLVVKVADSFKMPQCLVFCRTNVDCTNLETYLNRLDGSQQHRGKFESGKENPYSCVVLAGARSQKERQANLEAFKDGDVRFLICTDVAARGLDIAGLPYVIQMTLPDDIENYIHRIGRCGRAERMGLAIALVATRPEKVWYHKCPSRGKSCMPAPGNTKLTLPFDKDGKPVAADEKKFLVDEGGCTVWMDERDVLKRVEQRCGESIARMDVEDFSVDGVIESPLQEGLRKRKAQMEDTEPTSRRAALKRKKLKTVVVYGARKNDKSAMESAKQVSTLAPMVMMLGNLETKVQQLFAKSLFGAVHDNGHPPPTTAQPSRIVQATRQEPTQEKPKKKMRW